MSAETPDVQAYAIALGFSFLSCIAASVLTQWEDTVYFSLFFPAILLSAGIGGPGPAGLTLVTTFFWSWLLLTQRSILAGDMTQSEAVALAIFIVNAGLVAATGLLLRRGTQILIRQAQHLETNEERLDLAQRAGGVALWDWDIRSGRVVWNQQFYLNWGLNPSIEPSYEAFLNAIHPEDRDRVRRTTEEVLISGKPYDAEYRVPQSDGSDRWMSGRGTLIRDGAGNACRMIGVNLDITARKQAELLVRSQELRLTRFAETDVIGVLFGDTHGGIFFANNEFLRLIGYSRDDLKNGRIDWRSITPKEWLPLDDERIAEAKARGFCTRYEKEYIRKDGTRVPVLIGYSLIGDASVVVILDLTEQKRIENVIRTSAAKAQASLAQLAKEVAERKAMEDALAISEERFRSLAEQTDDVIWVVDAATRKHDYINPAYEKIWGRTRQDLYTNPESWLQAIHPDDQDGVKTCYLDTMLGRNIELDYRILRSDGSVRWINDVGFPIRGTDGQIKRIAGLARDITDRKKAEEQQRLLLAELNHRVKNTLATVQSLMVQSSRNVTDFPAFRSSFEARILALAKTHNILTEERWAGARLKDVVDAELQPHGGNGRIDAQGDEAYLTPNLALSIGIIIHELATNAAKYGCLSAFEGRLKLSWETRKRDKTPWLHFSWVEEGGPPVRAPDRKGFGSVLIERTVREEHGGHGEISFDPDGVRCTFNLPLSH